IGIAIVIAQFFPCLNISQGDNPDAASRKLSFTVRVTRVVDVAGGIAEDLAVDVVLVTEGKDVHIALGESLGTFGFGNPLSNILHNPRAFFDILEGKEPLACNM